MVFLVGIPVLHAQDTTDLTLFMTFIPNVQFSPVYVALEKAYFEGLNVTLQYGDEPDGVNLIAADEMQFGIISGEQEIQARANERPVVFVYEWFQEYPVGIVVAADSDIETVNDLAGRSVGIPGRFGASYSGLIALLSAAGMIEAEIELVEIGFNAPEVVCVGAVEAAVVYINNEPLQIEHRAEAGECGDWTGVRVLPVSAAVDMVSNGLVTNEVTIANNPELVQTVVTAFDAGTRDALNNPAEAYLLSGNYVENLVTEELAAALTVEAEAQDEFLATEPDAEAIAASRVEMRERLAEQFADVDLVQFDVLLNTIELWEAETLGMTDAASWDATQDVLLTMGFLQAPIDVTGAFTNDFVAQG
jgi:NitT/TauT family transport system substrate-binding protein